MKKAHLIIFFLFISIQWSISQSNKPVYLKDIPLVKHFDPTIYNGGIQNWSFDTDSSGILYVANNSGLLEFDGSNWTIFNVPDCTKLRSVLVDNKNRIIVGGQGQIGYFTMTVHGLEFNSLLNKLPPALRSVSETWKILEHNQEIFFNTESQLIVLKENDLRVLNLPGYIRQICLVDDRLIVQVYELGLFEFSNEEFIPIKGTKGLPDLIAINKNAEAYYYFSRSGQIFKHTYSGISKLDLQVDMGTINYVVKMKSGVYAIGTQNKGLFFLNADLSFKQHLTKNAGLSDRTVKSLYEDEFNNLWVGLNNGIDYLELSLPLSLINEEVGLDGTGYAACIFNDQIYLGTNNGLFTLEASNSNVEHHNYAFVPNSDGQVYNFSKINDELIMSHNRGAFQVTGKTLKKFHDIGSWKFMKTKVPGLYLGGDYQGISFFRKKNNEWLKIGIVPGLNESSRIMEFENDSILWMTHGSKGAFRLQFDEEMNLKGDVRYFGEKDGFPSNTLISVYSLNNKLVFTSSKGVFNFNDDTYSFSPNSFFNTWLGTNHISALSSNGGNTIYYIQDKKLGILIQENYGTYRKQAGLFKHVNKYINNDLTNINFIDNQNVLIGAKEGFICYNPNKKFTINKNFHVNIRSVEIASVQDSSITYSPSLNKNKEVSINQSLTFKYSAPFFDGFEDLQYSYRLVPLDENWSRWSSKGEKEYPYLPSGNYSFEVKGLNIYGQESPLVSYSFIVLTPWYITNLAIFFYFLFGLLILALIPIIQGNKYRKEKSILHQNKEQALSKKDAEIDQLFTQSKSEIDRLTNEKLKTELNLKNDQLTTITMQLMSSNEFIQDVRKKIESNIDGNGSTRDLMEIIKIIDNNLADNDSWDKFAYHFDQVHGDYLKKLSKNNINLSPREIKLAAFLRMNMSSKEISSLMNISTRGVELARHRLRKKLKLKRDQNLVEYLIDLDNK